MDENILDDIVEKFHRLLDERIEKEIAVEVEKAEKKVAIEVEKKVAKERKEAKKAIEKESEAASRKEIISLIQEKCIKNKPLSVIADELETEPGTGSVRISV